MELQNYDEIAIAIIFIIKKLEIIVKQNEYTFKNKCKSVVLFKPIPITFKYTKKVLCTMFCLVLLVNVLGKCMTLK